MNTTKLSTVTLPAAWLILLMVGVPFFSESVYTPSLPDIARSLATSDSLVEYTLTIYLFGIAVGTLFWGKISDRFGRKPCLIAGFLIFLLGCKGCYSSDTINMLLGSRFIQAFGGSVGSVLSQAIVRDAFHGPALGKMYSTVGASLAFFPAIGPVVGGTIDQYFGWSAIFLFLIGCALFVTGLVIWLLPETHPKSSREKVKIKTTLVSMSRDRRVIGSLLLVGLTNGINFSYYAEGPFFMIELLNLSPSVYGATFWAIAFGNFMGGYLAHRFHNYFSSKKIMNIGITTLFLGTLLFVALVFSTTVSSVLVVGGIICMMLILGGVIMTNSIALALALVNYKSSIGTASSLFGFGYYIVISLVTYGMGYLHNDTLYVMPLYFLALGGLMILINRTLLRQIS